MAIDHDLEPCLCSLPDEIVLQILRCCGWKGANNLGKTCRRFYMVCNDQAYWREQVSASFPIHSGQELFEDGQWKHAFKTLANSRVYAWGKGTGFMFDCRVPRGWDQDAHIPIEVEAMKGNKIVDIATGGWCTTMLTLSGEVVMAGSCDRSPRPWTNQPRRLNFPIQDTKIVQISAGRTHLLALSDKGDIWTYREQPHIIKFYEFDYVSGDARRTNRIHGNVKKVIAGWGASAAIVEGYGVVVWWGDLQHRDPNDDLVREGYRFMKDGSHVWRVSTKKIPFLAPWRHFSPRAASPRFEKLPEYHLHPEIAPGTDGSGQSTASLDDTVIDLMVGEDFLVAVTRAGGVFVLDIRNPHTIENVQPTQLLLFTPPSGQKPFSRVRGSFRTFAVLNDDGSIFIGNQDTIFNALGAARPSPTKAEVLQNDTEGPIILEDLQTSNIVDVAFADWHCLALTKTGEVLSWGRESGGCGSLGHGTHDEAARKGVTYSNAWAADGQLNRPTQIAFTPVSGANAKDPVIPRAHKIAAGGWHSCALVSTEEAELPVSENIDPTEIIQVDGAGESKPEEPAGDSSKNSEDPKTKLQRPNKGTVPNDESSFFDVFGFTDEDSPREGEKEKRKGTNKEKETEKTGADKEEADMISEADKNNGKDPEFYFSIFGAADQSGSSKEGGKSKRKGN